MKGQFKKVVAVILSCVLCFSVVGCSKNSGKDDTVDSSEGKGNVSANDSNQATDDNPYKEHMKISIALWNIGDAITDPSKDAVLKILEDKFNIEIEAYPVTWGDYTEKIKLWAASNSLPDMTAFEAGYTTVFDDWTEQGIVRALPSDVDQYPNVKKLLDSEYGQSINKVTADTENPAYYGIPRPTYQDATYTMLDYGVAIRKDWMNNVGVTTVPDNLDDLISLLKKFQTEDPDGNGKNDTIGLTGYNFAWMSTLFTGTCPAGINGFRWVYAEDGSLQPVWMSEEFLNGVKALKKIYDAGVMDPDYIIIKGEEGRDKFQNGKAGAYAHSGPELAALKIFEQNFEKSMPDKKLSDIIEFLPLFANDKGEITYPQANSCWSETYLSSKVSDAKAERCLALMDFLLSEEGNRLLTLGMEGTDYTMDGDGNVTLIDTKKEDGSIKSIAEKYPVSGLATLANWSSFRNSSNPSFSDEIKKMNTDYYNNQIARGAVATRLPNGNGIVLKDTAAYDVAGQDFMKYINDLMTAEDIDTAWQNMVNTLLKAGYDKVIKEENDLYKAAGRN